MLLLNVCQQQQQQLDDTIFFICFFLCICRLTQTRKINVAAGVQIDEKNWPPFFPIIHHDIANEIPVHAQKLQYLAFASWLGESLVWLVSLFTLNVSSVLN